MEPEGRSFLRVPRPVWLLSPAQLQRRGSHLCLSSPRKGKGARRKWAKGPLQEDSWKLPREPSTGIPPAGAHLHGRP